MVTDHTKTSSELKSMARGTRVLTEIDSAYKSKLGKLNGLNGADFDKQYISDQQSAHTDAVNLFERCAKGGESAELKGWADKTIPTLRQHKDMADKLQ